jgi:hypothetical protein
MARTTRKTFEAIATAIRDARGDITPSAQAAVDLVAENIAEVFAEDNPRFSRERFLAACDGEAIR